MKILKCHCGSVEAEMNLDGDLAKVVKCNKSEETTTEKYKNKYKMIKSFLIPICI